MAIIFWDCFTLFLELHSRPLQHAHQLVVVYHVSSDRTCAQCTSGARTPLGRTRHHVFLLSFRHHMFAKVFVSLLHLSSSLCHSFFPSNRSAPHRITHCHAAPRTLFIFEALFPISPQWSTTNAELWLLGRIATHWMNKVFAR